MAKKTKSEVLLEDMQGKWAEIKQIRADVLEDDRSFTESEKARINVVLDEVRDIELEIEKERKEEALHKSITDLDGLFSGDPDPDNAGDRGDAKGQRISLGDQFAKSDAWKGWLKQHAPSGRIPDSLKGISSPAFKAQGVLQKALITGTSSTSAGAFIVPEDTGIYESIGRYTLNLRSLISVRRTVSDAVEYVRQTLQVTQARPVPEANVTEYSGATGEVSGEKPEGTMTFERIQEAVKTIAVWIGATKRALSDAGQLSGLINDELLSDLAEELEDQLLNGNGIGENFTGLNNTAGTLVQAFNTDIAVTARMAITHLLITGRQIPTAFLFNPEDWQAYDLLQDANGRYYWGGPIQQGPRTLWGVPVAQSFFQTQGTGWLANWRKMVLWDREDASISVTDSHADFFIRNIIAVLAEMRAAMGIIRPSAFCEIDLLAGS